MLFEVVTIDLHYMAKNIKIENAEETKTPTSWGNLKHIKI